MSLIDDLTDGKYEHLIGKSDHELTQVARLTEENKSLKLLLTSAHEIIKKLEYSKPDYDGIRDECNFCNECEYTNRHSADCCVGKWLSDYERAIRGE